MDAVEKKPYVSAEAESPLDRKQSTNVGHVEELEKEFSIVSIVALQISLMATWEATSSVVAAALLSGGAPCLFYNYLISFAGTMCIASSMAELASIWPTAGGQYHWVANLAPPSHRLFISWLTGWISIGGQLVLTATAAFAAGLQFQALIVLHYPDTYVPARYQGMLFYWLVILYSTAINVWGSKLLPVSNNAAGILHIVGFIVIISVLGAMAPKHDAKYVFEDYSNSTGWTDGVSWLVGLLSTVYPFLGYDAAAHLSEELPNPRRNVPLAMIGSIIINGAMGLIFVLILLFCLGDLTTLLASPTGFPFMQLLYNSTNSYTGASILTIIITLTATAANSAGLTSTSRTAWAFARDDAIPFSKYFSHLSHEHHIPVRMVILLVVLQMALGLLYLGSSTAFDAVLSMAIFGMYLSYLLPVVYMLVYGRKKIGDDKEIKFGPFRMPMTAGYIINVIAILWMVVVCIFCNFPGALPVTATSMNYCVVVMMGWVVLGVAFYFIRGKKQYNGPILEALIFQ